MWGCQRFGVAIQNIVYDIQPGRSPGLLLINLSFHAVLIMRNMAGEGGEAGGIFPIATWRTLLDSSAANFCSQQLSCSRSPDDPKPQKTRMRKRCC